MADQLGDLTLFLFRTINNIKFQPLAHDRASHMGLTGITDIMRLTTSWVANKITSLDLEQIRPNPCHAVSLKNLVTFVCT